MSSSSTNPRAYPNSLLARIDALERGQARLAVAQPGKIKAVAAGNSVQGFAYAGTSGGGTSVDVTAPVAVPQFATTVSLLVFATAVVTCNSSSSAAAFSQLWSTIAELGIVQTQGPNVVVQINQQQQRSRALALASTPIPGGVTSLSVRARAYAFGTGTNADNFVGVDVIALFQY